MNLFNIFKKKPSIRFYSLVSAVHTLYPISLTKNLQRNWVAEEKEDYGKRKSKCPIYQLGQVFSINKCPAIHGIMNQGFVIHAPADFKVHTNGDNETILFTQKKVLHTTEYITTHGEEVTSWLRESNVKESFPQVIKVNTPWRIICDDDIVFLQTNVWYNEEKRFTAVTGIMDPKIAHEINVQIFWHVLDGDELIKAGTPLCQYIPISRSLLHNQNYIIDEANWRDIRMEDEYLYSTSSHFPENNNLIARISRMSKIIRKYKK
jgi:hypothetical protein